MTQAELITKALSFFVLFPTNTVGEIANMMVDFHLSITEQEKKDMAWEAWKAGVTTTVLAFQKALNVQGSDPDMYIFRLEFESWYTQQKEAK